MRGVAVAARFLVGVILVASMTGCFASMSQVDELREELNVVRTDNAAADSARVTQLVQILSTIRAIDDTLAALGTRLSRFRAESQSETRALRQAVMQVQEVSGQSQQRLQEMRATLEQRNRPPAVVPPSAGGDTVPATTAQPVDDGPGPNELFQLGRDQLSRGSNSAARAAFSDLLRRFPDSDIASDAQFHLGEAYAAEGNASAADSAYARVIARYPTTPRAPTALYKRGVIAQTARRTTAARRLFNELVKSYPESDEADLARERLRLLS